MSNCECGTSKANTLTAKIESEMQKSRAPTQLHSLVQVHKSSKNCSLAMALQAINANRYA